MEDIITADQNPASNVPGSENENAADQNPASNVPGRNGRIDKGKSKEQETRTSHSTDSPGEESSSDDERPHLPDHGSSNVQQKKRAGNASLKSIIKKMNKNSTLLRRHLNLLNEDEWKDWLRGPNFKPYWDELWDCWLSKQKKASRGPGLEQVLSVMHAHSEEFDERHVDKGDWNELHHYANFMHQILRKNIQHTDGLFKHRPMGKNEAEALLWTAMKYVQHKFAPSQRDRPSGGRALLNAGLDRAKKSGNQMVDTPRKLKRQKKGSQQNLFSNASGLDDDNSTAQDTDTASGMDSFHSIEKTDLDVMADQAHEINALMNATLTDSWKSMVRSYARERYPEKKSEEFDLEDPYWRLMFARTALQRAEQDTVHESDIPVPPDDDNESVSSSDLDHEGTAGTDPSEAVWRGSITDTKVLELATLPGEQNVGQVLENDKSLDYFGYEEVAAEQVDLSAEDPSPKFLLHVTEETLATYQKELLWLDNPAFQPSDFETAYDSLHLTDRQPDDTRLVRTRHHLMRLNTVLEPWQVLGVSRLIEIRQQVRADGSPMWRGAFLGDVMGLGKTFQAVAYMLEIYHRSLLQKEALESIRLAQPEESHPEPIYRPFLLILPSAILPQWIAEINQITKRLKVYVLFGNAKTMKAGTFKNAEVLKNPLTPSHSLFDGTFARANNVIVTTYDTFRSRHGPPAKNKWESKERTRSRKEGSSYVPRPWPGNISGCIHDVILDEGHTVRNPDSGLSTAIQWIQAKFHLIMSATIFFNGIHDFKGYMSLIIPEEADSIWRDDSALESLGVSKNTNPFILPDGHPASFLRVTRQAILKYIFTNTITVYVASVHLRNLLKHMIVRRTLSSTVQIGSSNFIIGSRFPPSQTRMINVDFSPAEKAMYDKVVSPHYRRLIMKKDGKVVINMAKYRMLTLLTSWLGMQFIHSVLTVQTFKEALSMFRLKTACQSLARAVHLKEIPKSTKKWFRSVRRRGRVLRPSVNALRTLLRGSPKMRAMLPIVLHNSLIRHEKQIIWCAFPASQVYVAAVLKECGIDAKIFHSKLDQNQRQSLIDDFNTSDKCSVLIMSLAVNALGLNLHPRCHIMHFFDMAPTKAILEQAIGRLRRFGQLLVVIVYIYSVNNSWNNFQKDKANEKAVTSMICDLNPAMFKLSVQNSEDISIENLVLRDGVLCDGWLCARAW